MKKLLSLFCVSLFLQIAPVAVLGQVPQLLNYQGRIAVNGTNFTGTGQFKFALVDGGTNVAAQTFWSNDGSSSSGGQPTASVPLPVTKGLYSVLLGDTTLSNMTALTASIFTNTDVRLRVWFNNGVTGFQLLTPDQRLAAVGYAIMAGTVPDGSITAGKIAAGAVGTSQLAPGAGGTLIKQTTADTNIQMTANTSYIITNAIYASTLTLPANPNIGDEIKIAANAGGIAIIANSNQSIYAPPDFSLIPRAFFSGQSIACSSDGSKLIVTGDYLYTSTDYGVTWMRQTNAGSGSWSGVASSSDGGKLVAGINGGYLYTSTDYGLTWSQRTNAGSGSWSSVAISSDGSKLVAGNNIYSGYLYTSTDYGVTWIRQTNAGSGYWSCVASSSDGSKLVAGKSGDYLYTSTDYGVTWIRQTNAGSGYWSRVASSSDGSKLVTTTGQSGTLYSSLDYGVTWITYGAGYWVQLTNAPTGQWSSVASSSDGSKLFAGQRSDVTGNENSGYLFISIDHGVTWARQPNSRGNWRCIASSSDGSKLIAGQYGGFLYALPNFITQWSTKYVYGAAYSSINLIYNGGGLWIPSSYTGSFTIQ